MDGRRLPGRPLRPEAWHVTLRFLGSTTPVQRDRMLAHLDETLQVMPFRVKFGSLGAFVRDERASVLWLGVDHGADALARLAEASETAAVAAGFEAEGRPFHPPPHIESDASAARCPGDDRSRHPPVWLWT
ncbi:MAG: RNA 2',3'-cyclic phosphodiesterase [Acidimicrobiia bacterium]